MLILLSPERMEQCELRVLCRLFDEGLSSFLLRLPKAPIEDYRTVIDCLLPHQRRQLIVADHHEALIGEYDLGGFYCSASRRDDYSHLAKLAARLHLSLGVGAHHVDELLSLPSPPTWALLSPVFDSISKSGYIANLQLQSMAVALRHLPFPVLAMGGITPHRQSEVARWGFAGVAALGSIWASLETAVSTFRQFARPAVLSVAGFDPTGGAGVLADHAVATDFGCRIVSIPTTLTIQSVQAVEGIVPVDTSTLRHNLHLNLVTNPIRIAKIGMTSSLTQLNEVVEMLRQSGVSFLIWDSILRTTASDYLALRLEQSEQLETILRNIHLVTPNRPEALALFGTCEVDELKHCAKHYGTSILLKGGHDQTNDVVCDILVEYPSLAVHRFCRAKGHQDMHGTGCQLSTAIACQLALGRSLPKACQMGQTYVSCAIATSNNRLSMPPISLRPRAAALCQDYRLQYLTNQTDPDRIVQLVRKVLCGGGKWVQLRMKTATTDDRVAVARQLLPLIRQYDATLIINDDVEAVLRSGADGVHLGQADLSPLEARRYLGTDKIIGFTCNTPQHLLNAWRMGVNYVGVGPYRYTTTKQRLAPLLGTVGLSEMVAANNALPRPLPLVAIGGIVPTDVSDLHRVGVRGIALSSAIEQATDIPTTIRICREIGYGD